MAGHEEEHAGATTQERLIEACRRNNVDLLEQIIEEMTEEMGNKDRVAALLNETRTVLGNYLFHEAAAQGHYEVIDLLLDQEGFECDPVNRIEGDTPLHTAIRWINSEPVQQREYGTSLVNMMLDAGCSSRIKNKGGLTPLQLVDPKNVGLREEIRRHEYLELNAGDFANVAPPAAPSSKGGKAAPVQGEDGSDDDDDAEFSGSDEEERAEWERRRRMKGKKV